MGGAPVCGLGDACCDGGTCTRGICSHGRCVAFAGAYEDIDMCVGACVPEATMPYLEECACPGVSLVNGPHPYLTDVCAGQKLPDTPGDMMLCTATNLGDDLMGSDWGGAFRRTEEPECFGPAFGNCVFQNPYTQDCSCPPDFTEVQTFAYAPCVAESGLTDAIAEHVFCVPNNASIITFGGLFQERDNGVGQPICEVINPRTGDCTCPSPTSQQGLRVINTTDHFGGTIFFCMTEN
jgi:hypothetical protein